MKSVYKITLDLHEMIAPIRIDAKVGDTARELEISFLERGVPWAIPAGTTATVSDGETTDTTFSASGEEVTWNENFVVAEDKITYRLNGAFTASEGTKKLEFKLIGEDGVLHTSTFMLNVYGKVTPTVDPEILTPTTLDDLDAMLRGIQTALENIDSLKERGYLITALSVNESNQLVVTMENAEGTEWVYTSDSLKGEAGPQGPQGDPAPFYTLSWYNNPTAEQISANAAVLAQISTLTPGSYQLVVKVGTYTIPANYINESTGTVIAISTHDGYSLRAYEFSGKTAASYRQDTWNYVEQNTFDEGSELAASQAVIAGYIEGKASAITVKGEASSLPVPGVILTEEQDAALTPEEQAARVLYFVVEDAE